MKTGCAFTISSSYSNFLDYGILLNIAPDHLNYHNSFKKYKLAKEKILQAKYSSHESDPYILYEWITGKKSKKLELQNLPFRFFTSNPFVQNIWITFMR